MTRSVTATVVAPPSDPADRAVMNRLARAQHYFREAQKSATQARDAHASARKRLKAAQDEYRSAKHAAQRVTA